jgi:hypothetical protein
VAEPLRVEVPTAALAQALIDRLRMFPTELMENGSCEVRVTLVGNPERAVANVLHSVDEWLAETGLDGVRVHLDERTYTLDQPQPA